MVARTGRFRRADRVIRSVEFQRISKSGHRTVGSDFVIVVSHRGRGAKPTSKPQAVRLGVSVSRRVGGAVVRNRVKRRIREWFRASRDSLEGETDVVVIARRQAAVLSGAETMSRLDCMMRGSRRVLPG